MNKNVILVIVLFAVNILFAQKMMTRNGVVKFEASLPAFEEIAATNGTVSCVFDKATGELASLALIKSFKFKTPLMEEHFNENYMESDKFSKATFIGKLLNYNSSKNTGTFDLEGEINIHGVSKNIKTKATLSNGGKTLICNFNVKPQDFKIKIPSIVKNKIAETVKITTTFELESK